MNRKGYSALIATIFMVLIVLFLYFNVFTFSLNRDKDFQDIISRSQQLDADRNAEQITITDVVVTQDGSGQIYITCVLVNNGSVPVQLARLWVHDNDLLQPNIANVELSTQSILLQQGSSVPAQFPPISIQGASYSDEFYMWLVTFRGNSFSKIV
jgi:hypothetical protein